MKTTTTRLLGIICLLWFTSFISVKGQCINSIPIFSAGTSAPIGPAATCNNNTGGDPTIGNFSYTVDPKCYDSLTISVTVNSIPVPGFGGPGAMDSGPINRKDSVNITIDGTPVYTMLGDDFDGENVEIYTTTIVSPSGPFDIDVQIVISGDLSATSGGHCAERLEVGAVSVLATDITPPTASNPTTINANCSAPAPDVTVVTDAVDWEAQHLL